MSDSMKDIAVMIFVGAFAFRGACSLMHTRIYDGAAWVPSWMSTPVGVRITQTYMFAAIPIAFLNGFLLHYHIIECIAVGIGTWLGMLAINLFSRKGPAFQLLFFGLVNLAWLTVNIVRAFSSF